MFLKLFEFCYDNNSDYEYDSRSITLPGNNNMYIMDSNPALITELYVGTFHETPNQEYAKITNNGN